MESFYLGRTNSRAAQPLKNALKYFLAPEALRRFDEKPFKGFSSGNGINASPLRHIETG